MADKDNKQPESAKAATGSAGAGEVRTASTATREQNEEEKKQEAARRKEAEQAAKEEAERKEADDKLLASINDANDDEPVEVTADNRDSADRLVNAGKASYVTEQSGPGGLDVKQTLRAS